MLVSVELLKEISTVVVTYTTPFNPSKDIGEAQAQIAEILQHKEGILYRIDNLSQAQMTWNQFVDGIHIATRDVPGSMTDARIRGILVGNDDMVKMASESMKQSQYGATQTPMFESIDSAIDYVRKQVVAD